MIDQSVIQYLLLCSIKKGYKSHNVNYLDDDDLIVVYSKKELELYFNRAHGLYIAKESIVGGDDEEDPHVDVY